MKVIKRNKTEAKFIQKKVRDAIVSAFEETGEIYNTPDITELINDLKELVAQEARTVDFIQCFIEDRLMYMGYHITAKAYILYRYEHDKNRLVGMMPEKAMQDYVFTSRYAKYIPALKRRETWDECVNRVRDMHLRKYEDKSEVVQDHINWAFEQVREKRVLPSMRSMQFAGPAIEKVNAKIYNCSFSVVDRQRFFGESMYALLAGCGVGFDVSFEHINKLSKLVDSIDTTKIRHYTIADSSEGWAEAVNELVNTFYETGEYVEFNYSEIRSKGMPLLTSGGKAPGHIALKKSLEKIRDILNSALGRKIKPIEAYDIVMHSCDAVLSGGIRRSASICLFSPTDTEMASAKTGDWFNENPQRGRSNNSAKLIRKNVTKAEFDHLFETQKEFGEPGFYFADDIKYGTNPCVEIGLYPYLPKGYEYDGKVATGEESGWAFCNLTEINGAKIQSEDDFDKAVRAASIIGTLQAGYQSFPYIGRNTELIVGREPLLGVSITGIMDSPKYTLNATLQRNMAELAVKVNKEFAEKLGINQAPRVTCVKPAGSTSLVLGTASGIHPRHAKQYFRRVQANKEDNVYQLFNSINSEMTEASVWSSTNTDDIITFCVSASEGAVVKNDISAMELLKNVKRTQLNWVEYGTALPESAKSLKHNVSNTISVKEDEWDLVRDYIWNNRSHFTGVSMLPATGDKVYAQAPHEEVVTTADIRKWNKHCRGYKEVDFTLLKEDTDNTKVQETIACGAGGCEL